MTSPTGAPVPRPNEQLLSYFKKLSVAERVVMAKAVGTTANHLKQMAYGNRPIPAVRAQRIDKFTGGVVDMRLICQELDFKHLKQVCRRAP